MRRDPPLLAALLALTACATVPTPPAAPAPPTTAAASTQGAGGTSPEVDIALARQQGRKPLFTWEDYAPAAFERARRENKLVLLDCVATWCHWCHVMDETTYTDPALGQLMRERVIALRIDVDARPDLASRYEEYGWPATILYDPRGEELGKFKGYLTPERLGAAIRNATDLLADPSLGQLAPPRAAVPRSTGLLTPPTPVAFLAWIGVQVATNLDDYYDREQGGWGRQKMVLGAELEFELLRAAHGDDEAKKRARFTLDQQRPLIDPVWGGVYQYSPGGVWTAPHFEKLLPIQTSFIEASARAHGFFGRAPGAAPSADLADAQRVAGYLLGFLRDGEGAFLVSQDADLGGHDKDRPFVDGHDYYKRDDAGRRALGVPRIDSHVYPYENGLAIAALTVLGNTLQERPGAAPYRDAARRAADLLLRTHVEPDGTVRREAAAATSLRVLGDAASLARGLALLATTDPITAPRYRDAAARIAETLWRRFHDPKTGLLFASTPDPAAVGVFARRTHPFDHNVLAARAFLALARLPGPEPRRLELRRRALGLLAALATPQRLSSQGRRVGEYLLALEESGALRWAR